MRFTAYTVCVFATNFESVTQHGRSAKRIGMTAHRFCGDLGKTDTTNAGMRASEIFFNERIAQADGVKNLRAAIGLIGRDAQFRHDHS